MMHSLRIHDIVDTRLTHYVIKKLTIEFFHSKQLTCHLSLNESTCQTRKNFFHFTSKALFVLEKIKF